MQSIFKLIFFTTILFVGNLTLAEPYSQDLNIFMWQDTPRPAEVLNNLEKLKKAYIDAAEKGADVFVTPEMYLTGYGLRDFFYHVDSFMPEVKSAINELRSLTEKYETLLVVGHPMDNKGHGKALFNGASLIYKGEVVQEVKKTLLPTYGEFEDYRYFEPSPEKPKVFEFRGNRLAFMICEDWWAMLRDRMGKRFYERNPVLEMQALNPDIAISLSSSPYSHGKYVHRRAVHEEVAKFLNIPFVYINEGAGLYDNTIADGRSFVLDARGNEVVRLNAFEDDSTMINFDKVEGIRPISGSKFPGIQGIDDDELTIKAMVKSIQKYAEITGMNKVVIGLSGGIDSHFSTAMHVLALGGENVHVVAMPGPYSSKDSEDFAREQARMFGIPDENFKVVPIVDAHEAMMKVMPHWVGTLAEENFQARLRYDILLGESNIIPGSYVVSNGNRSELYMGYFTVGGDNEGARALIMDLFKTDLYRLSPYLNKSLGREFIHKKVIDRPPTAELREGQLDSQSLPVYEILDPILRDYFDKKISLKQVAIKHTMKDLPRARNDITWVYKLIRGARLSEHKRHQGPIILQLNGDVGMDILSRRYLVGTTLDTNVPEEKDVLRVLEENGIDLSKLKKDIPIKSCKSFLSTF